MNKTLLSAALIAGFGIAAFAPQAARAADGTITFTGKVVANTCAFSVNSGSATGGPATNTIVLPVVFATALTTTGNVAGTTPFNIAVSGCDTNLASVQESWGGSNIAADGNLTNTGSAGNKVEVQLLNGTTNGVINLTSNNNSPIGNLTAGGVTLNYKAQYYANNGQAGTGLVNTSVTYTTLYQ